MGKIGTISVVLSILAAAVVIRTYRNVSGPKEAPILDPKQYWGPGEAANYVEDTSINQQEVFYEDATIKALRTKLNESITLHNPLEDIQEPHEYGINSHTLIKLVNYWSTQYLPNWSERQELLNSVPHYQTQIQGLKIHFVHIKPEPVKGKTIVPLLILHGWPGSVREFYDIFPLLTEAREDAEFIFEVIAPSLPGYGWSEAAQKVGLGPAEIAVVFRNLMTRLGHSKFIVQGGDWGALIGRSITALYPDNVIGFHCNSCAAQTPLAMMKLLVASFYPTAFVEPQYVDWLFPAGEKFKTYMRETGFLLLQVTKPDTIGIALSHNPVGLAAYFYEKWVTFYPNHQVDDILDIITIYYLTNSAHTAGRLYAEGFSARQFAHGIAGVPTYVPVACARFRHDLSHSLDWQLSDQFPNLVQSTWHEEGGHFAAMEMPLVLYRDLLEFVRKIVKVD